MPNPTTALTPLQKRPTSRGATRRTRTPALQAPHKAAEQDVEPYATKYSCSTHQVTYYMPAGERALCPVCDAEHQLEEIRAGMLEVVNELEMARNQLSKLRPLVDTSMAIKNALEMIGAEDLLWLKVQMYQYKIDKSVVLKVTHGRRVGGKKKRSELPNGFMAIPRAGEPEGYLCTSMGGLAIAEYFDEALHTIGSAQAMGLLLKAMWNKLPGAAS